MPDLSALIERLEKASGSDREIDCLLWAIQEGIELEWQGTTLVAGTVGVIGWCDPGATARNFYTNRDVRGPGSIPALTASIDAALAFVERVLPGAWYMLGKCQLESSEPLYGAVLTFGADDTLGTGEHPTSLPLAILIAALKALQEREGDG